MGAGVVITREETFIFIRRKNSQRVFSLFILRTIKLEHFHSLQLDFDYRQYPMLL